MRDKSIPNNEIRSQICVGVPTRGRTEMLFSALRSLTRQVTKDEILLTVLVVENNQQSSLACDIDEYNNEHADVRIRYVHESDPGVANARNAALSFAIREQQDFLAFMDDDEVADQNWISSLHAEIKQRKLDLVGGPVRVFTEKSPPRLLQRILLDCMKRRSVRKERQHCALMKNNRDHKIMLATNNWMVDMRFVLSNNLRFNPRFNLTGGEDSWFFREARKLHATTGWASQAVVSEELPLERLSIPYQLKRARDQSIVSFERKYSERPIYSWLVLPISVFYSFVLGLIFLILAPFTVGRTLLTSIRLFGSATGRLFGLLGIRTQHYSHTTGY